MKLIPQKELPNLSQIINPPDNLAKILKICLEMQVICEQERGIGLSAVQVGYPWKLFIVKAAKNHDLIGKKGDYGFFVNCSYEPVQDSKKIISLEGCLSIRNDEGGLKHFEVERFDTIHLKGQILKFDYSIKLEEIDITLKPDQQSIVFQHEIDHQLAKLISDSGKEIFVW